MAQINSGPYVPHTESIGILEWIDKDEYHQEEESLRKISIYSGWEFKDELRVKTITQKPQYDPFTQFSSDVTSNSEGAIHWLHRNEIEILDVSKLREKINKYPNLSQKIPILCSGIKQQFSTSTRISLDVYHDPEIKEEYLVVYIRQKKYQKDILDIIDVLREKYEERPSSKNERIFITTDFR